MSDCAECATAKKKVALITRITGQDGSYLAQYIKRQRGIKYIKKALITGITCQDGSYLAELLLSKVWISDAEDHFLGL